MNWIKDPRYKNVYYKKKQFGSVTYYAEVIKEDDKAFFAISSGKKRRFLNVFEEKEEKNFEGLAPLLWAKSQIYTIKDIFSSNFTVIIGWSDTRRQKIYTRFLPDFKITFFEKQKVLMKKFAQ